MRHRILNLLMVLAIVGVSLFAVLPTGIVNAVGEDSQEDISVATGGYVQVDPGSLISDTPYRVYWDAMPRNADAYHYFDFGAGSITGNFRYEFVSSFYTASGATGLATLFMLSDVVDDTTAALANVNANVFALYYSDTGAACTLYMAERDDAHSDAAVSQVLSSTLYRSRPLWYRVTRVALVLTVTIYDDPARGTDDLIYTLTHTWDTAPGFQYLFLCNSHNTGAATTATGFTSELYIDTQPTTFAARNQALIFKSDQEDSFEDFNLQEIAESNEATWVTTLGGTTTLVSQVASSDNEAEVYLDSTGAPAWTFVQPAAYAYAGGASAASLTAYGHGMQFAIAIPAGVHITSAYLTLNAHWFGGAGPWAIQITGEQNANAPNFTNLANYQARRGTDVGGANDTNLTSNFQVWDIATWTATTDYASPDISNIIQEIVDDEGTITCLGLFWDDHKERSPDTDTLTAHSYASRNEHAANKQPKLTVTYELVPGSSSCDITDDWARGGSYSARFVADETNELDWQAVLTPAVATFSGGILEADVQVASLGVGEIGQIMGMHDVSGYGVCIEVRENAGAYEWGIGLDTGAFASHWSGEYFSLNHAGGYHITLSMKVTNPGPNIAVLTVDGDLAYYYSWAGGSAASFMYDQIIMGYFNTNIGGTRYIDNIRYMDGSTFYPSVSRGGTDDGTLVAGIRVSDHHNAQFDEDLLTFFYSEDDGITWTWFDDIGPVVNTGYASNHVRWNNHTETWWVFVEYSIDTAGLAWTQVYECENPQVDTWTLRRDFQADSALDNAIFPSRIVDADDGSFIVGQSYCVDCSIAADWFDPSKKYLTAAHFSVDTYNLERESDKVFWAVEDTSFVLPTEPMVWYNTEGKLKMLTRVCEYGNLTAGSQLWVKDSNGDTDGVWDAAPTIMDAQFNDKNGLLRALVFQGDAWFQGRENLPQSAWPVPPGDWFYFPTFILRADRDTLDIKTEMWWPSLGEGGNGDIDCRQRQFDGAFTMDLISDFWSNAWFMELDHFTGIPFVSTEPAVTVGVTRATLRGYLDDGATCDYRFVYGFSELYTDATAWTASVDAGDSFQEQITGLEPGRVYHFRAEARNAYGSAFGEDMIFTTSLTVGNPSSLVAMALSSSQISLNWVLGSGSTESIVRYKLGSFPTSVTDGGSCYAGPNSSNIMTGCLAGTTYYFRVWGHDEPDYYSPSYAEAVCTTPAGVAYVDIPPTPGTFADPSVTAITGMPGYGIGTTIAGYFGMTNPNWYLFVALAVCALISVAVAAQTGSVSATILVTIVSMGFCTAIGIITWPYIFIYVIIAGAWGYVKGGQSYD